MHRRAVSLAVVRFLLSVVSDVSSVRMSVEAPVLVDFWLENFRLQVEARSGELRVEVQGIFSCMRLGGSS